MSGPRDRGGSPSRSVTRSLGRSLAVLSLLAIVGLAGCSAERAQEPPWCAGGGSGLLAAQSVPTASQVPCFESLPAGWHTSIVRVDQNGMFIRFNSDRAGDAAALFHYESDCDRGRAVWAPSEFDDVDRFDFVGDVSPRFRAERFYVFEGGCVWWAFDFDPGVSAALAIEIGDRLSMITRDDLNESIRATFIDAEI